MMIAWFVETKLCLKPTEVLFCNCVCEFFLNIVTYKNKRKERKKTVKASWAICYTLKNKLRESRKCLNPHVLALNYFFIIKSNRIPNMLNIHNYVQVYLNTGM